MNTGATFGAHTIRVTEVLGAVSGDEPLLGETLTRKQFTVRLTPVIAAGETHVDRFPCGCIRATTKEVDRFQYFEFELTPKGWRRFVPILDSELRKLLARHCAVEFWTQSFIDNEPDPEYPWIHWLFPSTSWSTSWSLKGRAWLGRSHDEGPDIRPPDLPFGEGIESGGFWKTATPPPS